MYRHANRAVGDGDVYAGGIAPVFASCPLRIVKSFAHSVSASCTSRPVNSPIFKKYRKNSGRRAETSGDFPIEPLVDDSAAREIRGKIAFRSVFAAR